MPGTEFLPGQAGEASSSSTTTPAMAPQAGANNTLASGQDGEAEGGEGAAAKPASSANAQEALSDKATRPTKSLGGYC